MNYIQQGDERVETQQQQQNDESESPAKKKSWFRKSKKKDKRNRNQQDIHTKQSTKQPTSAADKATVEEKVQNLRTRWASMPKEAVVSEKKR